MRVLIPVAAGHCSSMRTTVRSQYCSFRDEVMSRQVFGLSFSVTVNSQSQPLASTSVGTRKQSNLDYAWRLLVALRHANALDAHDSFRA